MSVTLKLDDLQAGYGRARVVRGITLECRAGEITALLGRNGVGKTTTLSAIAGLIPTTGGSVLLDGQPVSGPAHRRARAGFALVQEGKRVFRQRSVEENLRIGAYAVRQGRRELSASVDDAYRRFPILRDKRRDAAGSLSGGQQQMLAIAQALMAKPRVLMLDEPSAGLAPVIVDEVFGAIAELKKEGLCVLLVEQLIDNSLAVSDHVAVLDHGTLVINQTVASLRDWDVLREVYLGGSTEAPPASGKGTGA
jgi:branched-chain amino acid transport system ATP-binding protein